MKTLVLSLYHKLLGFVYSLKWATIYPIQRILAQLVERLILVEKVSRSSRGDSTCQV